MTDKDGKPVEGTEVVQCTDDQSCIVGPFGIEENGSLQHFYICGTENVIPEVNYVSLLVS